MLAYCREGCFFSSAPLAGEAEVSCAIDAIKITRCFNLMNSGIGYMIENT